MLDLKITFKLNIVCILIMFFSCSRLKKEFEILYAEQKVVISDFIFKFVYAFKRWLYIVWICIIIGFRVVSPVN